MEYFWLLLIVLTMVVYPVVLVRSAMKGKRWARETLEAMQYLGGESMTSSVWRAKSLEPERPPAPPPADEQEDPGRLVA